MLAAGLPRASSLRIVAMLTLALFINYVDRGALPTAAHLIQDDLHLRESQLGLLMSAFFWTYALSQMPVGALAERFGAHRVLGFGVAIWAVATLLVGLTSSFAALIGLRLLLGLGESAAFPCSSKIIATAIPVESLGKANGMLAVGYLLGPAFGTAVGGILMANYGWRSAFVAFGALSLLWLWPWAKTKVDEPAPGLTRAGVDTPSLGMIVRQRALWGAGLGHFAANYTFYFMLSWLPFYLVRERGYSTEQMAVVVSAAWMLNAAGALVGGWAIDAWIRRGGSTTFAYKLSMALGHGGAIVCMLAITLGNLPVALGAIFTYQFLSGVSCPGVFAVPQIFAGAAATGRWVGMQNFMGNLAGIVAPWVTGALVERTGHFQYAFFVGAAVAVLGVLGWIVILPKIRPIQWRYPAAARLSAGT